MKRIVLCEGKRDVQFLVIYYQDHSGDLEVNTFHGEEVSHSRLTNEESQKIRNFQEARNPYDILIKSENGVETLKHVFIKLVHWLVRSDLDLCLLIDLDCGSYEALIEDLDHRVRSNYQGKELGITHDELVERGQNIRACTCRLTSARGTAGAFDLLAFDSNLEEAANISDEDTWEEESRKLREFIERTPRTSILQKLR